jgi:hypothetical protein
MKPGGWEIRPLGWLLLIVLVVFVCYIVVKRVPPLPPAQDTMS